MGMHVNFTPHLEDLVRRKVASGLYNSASEVVRDALRLMEEQDQIRALGLGQLRAEIQRGLDSGPGEPWDAEAMKRQGRERQELASGIRSFPFGCYVIFFLPIEDGIDVAHVMHSAMDIKARFDPDGEP